METTEYRIPAVALRGMVVLPEMVTHFDVSRSRSIKAVEQALSQKQNLFCGDTARSGYRCAGAGGSVYIRNGCGDQADREDAAQYITGTGGRYVPGQTGET